MKTTGDTVSVIDPFARSGRRRRGVRRPTFDVAQHDEVCVVVGEALHAAGDAWVSAAVSEPASGMVDEPVGVAVAVAESLPRLEDPRGDSTHQRVVRDAVEESVEVGHRAERSAVDTTDHGDGVDVGAPDASGGVGVEVADGRVGVGFVEWEEAAGAHPGAIEDAILDQVDVGSARDVLQHDPEQDVASVAVLPGAARRPVASPCHPRPCWLGSAASLRYTSAGWRGAEVLVGVQVVMRLDRLKSQVASQAAPTAMTARPRSSGERQDLSEWGYQLGECRGGHDLCTFGGIEDQHDGTSTTGDCSDAVERGGDGIGPGSSGGVC